MEIIPANSQDQFNSLARDRDSESTLLRIQETESRFRTMADTAPVLLWMARRDGLCDFFNQGWLDFTGRSAEQEFGNGWAEGIHPEDFARSMQTYLDAFVARSAFSMEYRLRRHDGQYRWIFDQGAPRFDGAGRFEGFIGSCVDVTAQREARDTLGRLNQALEEQVRERTALVAERETMLREVHHRVKNDLQLISSLLSLQERQFGDSLAARAFEECQARVQAIAQIHEQMYQSDDLAQLSFSEHLRGLTAYTDRAIPGAGVELSLDISEDVILRVDRAIPCAMIVHELVVNAFKHAFPNGKSGKVNVSCHRDRAGGVRVVVEDDGVGMRSGPLSERKRGLGWELVEAFARQLSATLELGCEQGTRVELNFVDGSQPSVRAGAAAAGSGDAARGNPS